MGFAASLADEHILNILFANQHQFRLTESYQHFMLPSSSNNFISFCYGLTFFKCQPCGKP
jgi:hypothetical protein